MSIKTPTTTEEGIKQTLLGLSCIADEGGYVERREALETIARMQWFDNFGADLYHLRLRITKTLAKNVEDDDIPEVVKEELEADDY